MREFFILFVLIQLFFIESKSFAQEVNPANTLSTENFGWKDVDTVYYNKDSNAKKIQKIITNGNVSEYYLSGNLKATGQVVKRKCEKIYDNTGNDVLYELCDFSLEGKWNVYYDSPGKHKAATVYFKNSKWISRSLIAGNGCVYQKELVDRKLIQIEKYDENCRLAQKELIFPFQGNQSVLRRTKFEDGKIIEEKRASDLAVFVAKYYDIFFGVVLFFAVIKFALSIFYFQQLYKNNETIKGNRRRLFVSLRGTFTMFIRVDHNDENYFMTKVHNFASVIFLLLSVFFLYNLYII